MNTLFRESADDLVGPDSSEVSISISGALTSAEFARLGELESHVKTCFTEGISALQEIKDKRLYREKFATFEAYIQSRWGMVASRFRQLTAAAGVIEDLKSVTTVTLPTNERQARELVAVPKELRADVWSKAVEESDGKPTAAAVKEAAEVILACNASAFRETPKWDQHELDLKERLKQGEVVLAVWTISRNLVIWAAEENKSIDIGEGTPYFNPMPLAWTDGDKSKCLTWYREHWLPYLSDDATAELFEAVAAGGVVLVYEREPETHYGDEILRWIRERSDPRSEPESVATSTPESNSKKRRLTDEDIARIRELHTEGLGQVAISRALGCSQSTVCTVLKRSRTEAEEGDRP